MAVNFTNVMNNITTMLAWAAGGIGAMGVIWSLIQLGLAVRSDDSNEKNKATIGLVGSGVILAVGILIGTVGSTWFAPPTFTP